MKIVYPGSLGATVDAINEALFYSRPMGVREKRAAVKWLAERVNEKGSYAGMPAPTAKDFSQGAKVFTGEEPKSRASLAHILGEEACRAMILLGGDRGSTQEVMARATAGMLERLKQTKWLGMYCCGTCSCGLWRHLAAGGLDRAEERLKAGVKILKAHRDGTGKWRRFPFNYTLLALTEMKVHRAVDEMRYAAVVCEKMLARRSEGNNKYTKRRRAVMERVLSMI